MGLSGGLAAWVVPPLPTSSCRRSPGVGHSIAAVASKVVGLRRP